MHVTPTRLNYINTSLHGCWCTEMIDLWSVIFKALITLSCRVQVRTVVKSRLKIPLKFRKLGLRKWCRKDCATAMKNTCLIVQLLVKVTARTKDRRQFATTSLMMSWTEFLATRFACNFSLKIHQKTKTSKILASVTMLLVKEANNYVTMKLKVNFVTYLTGRKPIPAWESVLRCNSPGRPRWYCRWQRIRKRTSNRVTSCSLLIL